MPDAPLVNDCFLRACRGDRPDRTPVWLMRQAGRYLPEYRAVRSKVSFTELCRSPDLCAEVTLQPLDRFDLDAAILFSDILVVFDVFGIDVKFEPSPVLDRPVRTEADVQALRRGDVETELAYVFDAVRACKRAIAGRVPLIGFCGAPFTTLSYLVEGSTTKTFEHSRGLMRDRPDLFGRLMEQLTELLVAYLGGQVRAGVDAIQIFDSWAGALSPAEYREHVLPHLARLVTQTQTLGVPVIVFCRGGAGILELVRPLEAQVFGVDFSVPLDEAIARLGPDKVVQGNLDPSALLGPVAEVEAKAREIVRMGRAARAHVFNLGHGILPATPPDVVTRLVEVVHEPSP